MMGIVLRIDELFTLSCAAGRIVTRYELLALEGRIVLLSYPRHWTVVSRVLKCFSHIREKWRKSGIFGKHLFVASSLIS